MPLPNRKGHGTGSKMSSKQANLKMEEMKQLESFLKTRGAEVDQEIAALKGKLKVHNIDVSLPEKISDFRGKANAIIAPSSSTQAGTGILTSNLPEAPRSSVNESMYGDTAYMSNGTLRTAEDRIPSASLQRFLKRVVTATLDQGFSADQLREYILPAKLIQPNQTAIPLDELLNVLQVDLAMPVEDKDMEEILITYRTNSYSSDVDVKMFLQDAGLWSGENTLEAKYANQKANSFADVDLPAPIPNSPAPSMGAGRKMREVNVPMDHSLALSPSPVLGEKFTEGFKDPSSSPTEPVSPSQLMVDGVIAQAKQNIESLHSSHNQLHLDISEEQRTLLADKTTKQRLADEYMMSRDLSNGESMETLRKSHEMLKKVNMEKTRTEVLEAENDRLKRELATFDADFFDQVEDLKYRYSNLQEIVGEAGGNVPFQHVRTSSDYHPGDMTGLSRGGTLQQRTGQAGPIDGRVFPPGGIADTAWGARNNLSALDRAGLTYPIAAERGMQPSPYTYSPGGVNVASVSSSISLEGANVALGSIGSRSVNIASPTRMGGTHGLGGGTHSATGMDGGAGYSDLCERRLVFELSNHSSPSQATRNLIHRLSERAMKQNGYVNVSQLFDIMKSCDLQMSLSEVEQLAIGFAGDGKGSIDGKELTQAIHALMYNVLGGHKMHTDGTAADGTTGQVGTDSNNYDELGLDPKLQPIKQLLMEVCDSILVLDRKAVLGEHDGTKAANVHDRKKNRMTMLVRPFLEIDTTNTGLMNNASFSRALKGLGVMLTIFEMNSIAQMYAHTKAPPIDRGWGLRSSGEDIEKGLIVSYKPFLKDIIRLMERQTSHENTAGSSRERGEAPWILKEFDLVDALIEQMELMKPSDRRRALMSLQYALHSADTARSGEVDGFTVLKSILGAGFRMQRIDRVRLLRAAEELGGKMKYTDLFEVLIKSTAEWDGDEQAIVGKILSSMGVTVLERRAWMARLRHQLMVADSQSQAKRRTDSDPGISPASFLHVLRECGVQLTIEEEATLLDCLDTERQAEQLGKSYSGNKPGVVASISDSWSVPQIHYKSFLSFVGRHCGHWSDAAPELARKLKRAIQTIGDKNLAVHELNALMLAFDEDATGKIGKRAFQVACHRSRLLSNMKEEDVERLSSVLSTEGAGQVLYVPFMVHVKGVCSKCNDFSDHDIAPDIAEQLLKNALDAEGTLMPLRSWLVRHTDCETYTLTPRDMNGLLREFSVVYRPEDLEAFIGELASGDSEDSPPIASTRRIVDTRDLLKHLIKLRGPWSSFQKELCIKIRNLLKIADGTSSGAAAMDGQNEYERREYNKDTDESAVARKMITRLRALSSISNRLSSAAKDGQTLRKAAKDPMPEGFIEATAFAYIVRGGGLTLSDKDIGYLADATDFYPFGENVRYNAIVEALVADTRQDTEANRFALNHLIKLLWTTATKLHRSKNEWVADVTCVFKGFDKNQTGFISTEDFKLALSLLTVPLSNNIVKDLPMMPVGDGLVPYMQIIEPCLEPPGATERQMRQERLEMEEKSANEKHAFDQSDFARTGDMLSIKKRSVDNYHRRTAGVTEGEMEEQLLQGYMQGALNEGRGRFKEMSTVGSPLKSPQKDHGYGITVHSEREAKAKQGEFYEIHKNQYKNKDHAVQALIKVVRKCLKDILQENGGRDLARKHMLKAFRRFDTEQTERVTPRDFCLAVSVLIGDDAIVLNKQDWTDIIAYYIDDQEKFVEYEMFCEKVLNTQELQSSGPNNSSINRRDGGRKGTNGNNARGSKNNTRRASTNPGYKNAGRPSSGTDDYNLNKSYGLSVSGVSRR